MATSSGLRLARLYSLGRSRTSHKVNDLGEAVGKNEIWCKEYKQRSSGCNET